mmetsp:Transcript_33514/g.81008  ORF Transcript_33514/g.81008 Transcript_33514/m.81008 type:complete len:915 (-) Transcript_33514:117-2861(-)
MAEVGTVEGQRRHPPHPRGRPSSYPTVVTTTTDNPPSAVSDNNGNANTDLLSPSSTNPSAPVPPSLEAALRLYERDGDAVASLGACRRIWGRAEMMKKKKESGVDEDKMGAAAAAGDGEDATHIGGDGFENIDDVATAPLSRRHNRTVLEHLSSLRSARHRVRPRPSSFDKRAVEIRNGGDRGGREGDDLSVALSRMLTVSESSSRGRRQGGGGAAKNNDVSHEAEQLRLASVKAAPTAVAAKLKGEIDRGSRRELATSPLFDKTVDTVGGYNRLVAVYNVCLSQYAAGHYQEALDGILDPFLAAMESIQGDSDAVKMKAGDDTNIDASGDKKKELRRSIGHLFMTTRIAFLVLDCHMAFHGGNGLGMGPISSKGASVDGGNEVSIQAEEVVTWIENNALSLTAKGSDAFDHGLLDEYESFTHDEVKFRLHLFRARMLFLRKNGEDGNSNPNNDMESRTRVSRKELKNAMDIYQNKLCVVEEEEGRGNGRRGKQSRQYGGSKGSSGAKGKSHQDVSETTSVTSMAGGSLVTSVSDAFWSEGKGGLGATRATFEGMPSKNAGQQQQTPQPLGTSSTRTKVKKDTPSLQVRHESVLYLKANLEYLRGNTSKSLKLCAEARSAGKKSRLGSNNGRESKPKENEPSHYDDPDGEGNEVEALLAPEGETQMASHYDEAIYYNNLALLHQSAGKVHLALHYYSYALSYIEQTLDEDSSVTPSSSRNFWSSGMACPDITADIHNNISLCAFQAQEFGLAYESMARCVKMSPTVFGKRARCWLRLAQSCIGIYTKLQQKSEYREGSSGTELDSRDLGRKKDLTNILMNPLPRASFCLYRALHLSAGILEPNFEMNAVNESIPSPKEAAAGDDVDCFEMALVSLAYVKVQLGDSAGALQITKNAMHRPGSNGYNKAFIGAKQH